MGHFQKRFPWWVIWVSPDSKCYPIMNHEWINLTCELNTFLSWQYRDNGYWQKLYHWYSSRRYLLDGKLRYVCFDIVINKSTMQLFLWFVISYCKFRGFVVGRSNFVSNINCMLMSPAEIITFFDNSMNGTIPSGIGGLTNLGKYDIVPLCLCHIHAD